MKTILYPTRGGQSSYPNQDRVIRMAKEMQARLIFLHVSNVHFLDRGSGPSHLEVLEEELDRMSEFLLAMAQERTRNAGWEAEAVTRQGGFRSAIYDVIEEYGAEIVILGAPGDSHAVTTSDILKDLMHTLVDERQVEVFVLRDGEVLEHRKPE